MLQYATRPFAVGDRVAFYTVGDGSLVCQGTVAALHPTRTVLAGEPEPEATAEEAGTFFVNNGAPARQWLHACHCD